MSSAPSNLCPTCGVFLASEPCKTYPSPSAEMLKSNTAYSSAQTREFSKTIADVETNMGRLDEEISRLQKAMDHLQNERQKLEASLDEYRSLAAPIRTRSYPKSFPTALWITPKSLMSRKRPYFLHLRTADGEQLPFQHHVYGLRCV
jgi:septal ring factor EnvC (AmiA/AmiB activator)